MAVRDYTRQLIQTSNLYQPQAKPGIDLAGALSAYRNTYQDTKDQAMQEAQQKLLQTKQNALANALKGGDETQINAAYADLDPLGRMAQIARQQEQAQIFKNSMALEDKRYQQQRGLAALKQMFGGQNVDTKGESSLRKEFNDLTSDYRKVGDSFSRIMKSAENPSAAGDLSLIFNYMKMLDPGSVVRESEFANAENARAWFDRSGAPTSLRLGYEKAVNGTKLLDEQRNDFIDMSRKLLEAQRVGFENNANAYTDIAKSSGYDPARIVIDPYKDLMIQSMARANTENPVPANNGNNQKSWMTPIPQQSQNSGTLANGVTWRVK